MYTLAEMADTYTPALIFLQETKCHKIEETGISNKLGKGRPFFLNSNDQYLDELAERLEVNNSTAIHGTGTVINTDVAGKDYKVYEPVSPRIQHVRLNNISYLN